MNINQFFYEHPVFRYEEFVAFKQAQGLSNIHSIKTAIQYYLKTNRIKRIRRELYAVIAPNETSDTKIVDPYLIAGKAAEDSVLAYHTALELHGFAYSVFQQFTYLTQHKINLFEYQSQLYKAISWPQSLIKKGKKANFGIEIVNRQGIDIRITSISRTFVDVLDKVELSGGWEEVYRSISNISVLDIDDVINYCLLLDNSRLAAKVGYFLEKRKGGFLVPDKQLKRLIKAKPTSPQYITKRARLGFRLIKKWNLIMPIEIMNETWEEQNVNF